MDFNGPPDHRFVGLGTVLLVRPAAPPRNPAERALYHSGLKCLAAELLLVLVDEAHGTKRGALAASIIVPLEQKLEFTADGWACLDVCFREVDAPHRRPPEVSLWRQLAPDGRIPFHARLGQAVDGSRLVLEWRFPAGSSALRLEPAAGAAAAEATCDSIAEPCPGAAAGRPDRPRRPAEAARTGARPHRLTVHRVYRHDTPLPALRLSGTWLARLGFTTGQQVAVLAEPGKLVLQATPAESPAPPSAPGTEISPPPSLER